MRAHQSAESDLEVVRKAYRTAELAHRGQLRLSGLPYVSHCLNVAYILAELELDTASIAAGILHDVLEDTPMKQQEIAAEFGADIAMLVDGVTMISSFPKADTGMSRQEKQALGFRKMLAATVKDVRVLLIKLADRLDNMRSVQYLPPEKIQRISRETLDIYAPLAHRLGIAVWKAELEDCAFRWLYPQEYDEIAARLRTKRSERLRRLKQNIEYVQQHLAGYGIQARVIGRPKHFYSIYRKMIQRGVDFDGIMDLEGIRIITETKADCYQALGVVHQLWPNLQHLFRDNILRPKENGYQTIHTTVMCEDGKKLEIQIRTEEMDQVAQVGVAAHWRYKEGNHQDDGKLDEQLAWLRQMYEWLKEASGPEELLEGMRRDVRTSDIYVFTPKGEVKELPKGATPLDFAYLIHSEVGHHCIAARANGRVVPLRYNLQTGDVVEILTSKNQTPHRNWLDIAVTGRAKTRIRQRLREIGAIEPLEEQPPKPREHHTPAKHEPPAPSIRQVDDATRRKLIRIQGAKGMAVQFAKCCDPMPGHAIVGYVTRNPGLSVHRAECSVFARMNRDPKRTVEASWEGEGVLQTAMRVIIGPRPNVLADITNALRPMNIDIISANYGPRDDGKGYFDFMFEVPDQRIIDSVMRTLRTVPGLSSIKLLWTREQPHPLNAEGLPADQ